MNYEQMQIALCEWAGIVIDKHTRLALPDCNSLDVLAEFEAKLTDDQHREFRHQLRALILTDNPTVPRFQRNYISSSAERRRIALVHALGLWITDESGDQKLYTPKGRKE